MPTSRFKMSAAIIENVKGEFVLHLGGCLLILGVDVQNIPVQRVEPHAGKQTIERGSAHDKRHAGDDCLIFYGREVPHRSPGHHVDGGSFAEILVGSRAAWRYGL